MVVLVSWLREPTRPRGYLAVAIGGISVIALIGSLPIQHPFFAQVMEDVAIVAFMASGYALLLFRNRLIPYRAPIMAVATVLMGGITLLALVVQIPGASGPKPSSLQSSVVALLILAWTICLVEPLLRFFLVSFRVPPVQSARLRALCFGFGGLVVIFLLAIFGTGFASQPWLQIGTQALALLLVPALYAAFVPPGWLRREWRVPEERALQAAVQNLLLYSPDQKTLAQRAVYWARRLVGGRAAAIFSAEGQVWALEGIDIEAAESTVGLLDDKVGGAHVEVLPGGQPAVVAGLPMENGTGTLVVLAGPFTPIFGSEEVGLLQQYASAITVGLDRTLLTERLAALERTKSEFLNLASHELRGPITVIRGYLSMIERGSLGVAPQEILDAIPVLSAKAEQMNLLVEQMLEAARLEEGRLELKPETADLRDIAAQAVELMRPLGDASHQLVLQVPEQPVRVEVDTSRISTIITNLIENAIKYSPKGGEVQLAVTAVDGVGEVSVTDRGVGIAEADLPKLFSRFGRIATPQTRHIGGTGLGLYLSRELARLHGGDIHVRTAPGQGSTFQLTVPLQPSDSNEGEGSGRAS